MIGKFDFERMVISDYVKIVTSEWENALGYIVVENVLS